MSDPRPAPRRLQRGFTLIEVVLAMTAVAMITAICYGAFHLAIRAVERGEVAVVASQRLRVAGDVVDHQIKSIVPYFARNQDGDTYPYFQGTATSVAFVTASALAGGGGLLRVIYRVLDDPPRLVLTETPVFSADTLGRDQADLPGEASAVVLDGFRTLRFEYLMNDGVDTEWVARWDGYEEETLPSAVRMVVEGLPGLESDASGQAGVGWGTEKPVMLAVFGEDAGDLSEELLEMAEEQATGEGGDEDVGADDEGDTGDADDDEGDE